MDIIDVGAAVKIIENQGGGGGGDVTGVKGDAESLYRKGNVNLTPANLGIEAIKSIGAGLSLDAETGELSATGIGVQIDDEMSASSTNPVQNKVITGALGDKVDKVQGKGLSEEDYTSAEKTKLSGIETGAEVNVQSDWEAESGDAMILHKPTLGTAAAKDSTNAVTANSTDLVESGAVKSAIDAAIASVYKPAGDKTVAQLVAALLIADNLGNVYNVTDSGTTTADFVGGAGNPIKAGDNVAVVDVGSVGSPSYKFDLLSGFVDLTNYVQKSLTSGLLKNDGTVDTTQYLTQHQDISGKQNKTLDTALTIDGTSRTTVEAALGALNTHAGVKVLATVSGSSLAFTDASIGANSVIDGPYIKDMIVGIDSVSTSGTTITYTLEDSSANGKTAYIWVRN